MGEVWSWTGSATLLALWDIVACSTPHILFAILSVYACSSQGKYCGCLHGWVTAGSLGLGFNRSALQYLLESWLMTTFYGVLQQAIWVVVSYFLRGSFDVIIDCFCSHEYWNRWSQCYVLGSALDWGVNILSAVKHSGHHFYSYCEGFWCCSSFNFCSTNVQNESTTKTGFLSFLLCVLHSEKTLTSERPWVCCSPSVCSTLPQWWRAGGCWSWLPLQPSL